VTCIGLWRSGTVLNRMEAHALLAGLFVIIWRSHLADQSIASQVPSALQHLDGYLRHHLQEQVTLQKMAEQVDFSVPHMIRLCKQHWNRTPHQHLLYLRLQHSLLLLQNVDLSITRVASYCGFADTQHFVHVFRKHFSLTPTQTRAAAGSPMAQAESGDRSRGLAPLPLPVRSADSYRGARKGGPSREGLLSLAR
jgi:AraC-like DNA-binding protein